MQTATRASRGLRDDRAEREREWRTWSLVQAVVSVSLLGALIYAGWAMAKFGASLPLAGWSRVAAWVLIGGGVVAFGARSLALILRSLSPPPKS